MQKSDLLELGVPVFCGVDFSSDYLGSKQHPWRERADSTTLSQDSPSPTVPVSSDTDCYLLAALSIRWENSDLVDFSACRVTYKRLTSFNTAKGLLQCWDCRLSSFIVCSYTQNTTMPRFIDRPYLVFTKDRSISNTVQQRVRNLTSCSSHEDSDWLRLQRERPSHGLLKC